MNKIIRLIINMLLCTGCQQPNVESGIDLVGNLDSYTYTNDQYDFSITLFDWWESLPPEQMQTFSWAEAEIGWQVANSEAYLTIIVSQQNPMTLGIAGLTPLAQSSDYFYSYTGSYIQSDCESLTGVDEQTQCLAGQRIWEEEVIKTMLPSFKLL